MTMMRFRWQEQHTKDRILALPTLAERQAGKAAYLYLYYSGASMYKQFDDEHKAFLNRHPGATECERLQPLKFIERDSIECALWPWLFWKASMTFSRERLTNPSRGQRRKKQMIEFAKPSWIEAEHIAIDASDLDNKCSTVELDETVVAVRLRLCMCKCC